MTSSFSRARRKDLYDEYKHYYKENIMKNPYSSQSIAELLDISHEYYKRLESFEKTKPISYLRDLKSSRQTRLWIHPKRLNERFFMI